MFRRCIVCCSLLMLVSAQRLLGQPIPDRLAIRRELEPRFPLPAEPSAPVAPTRPGAGVPVIGGLIIGGGIFAATATLCGKTQYVGANPYGGRYNGSYVAPGEVVNHPAPVACTAGFGVGAAALSGWLIHRARVGSYSRATTRYQQDQASFATTRAAWERQVASRNRALDSAVVAAHTAFEAATVAVRTRAAAEQAEAALAAEIARAEAAANREIPLLPPMTGLKNPDAVAVVIGNQNYSRGEVPSVDYAGRDAEAMRKFLVQTFGFRVENIIFEKDASFTTLTRIFGSATDPNGQLASYVKADGSSDVFIFYSGHGAPDPGTGTAYLVSSDADPQTIRLTGYPMRQLQTNLAQVPARSITMVLDACFSGLADRGSLLRGISPISMRVENPVLTHPNSVILTASQATQVSSWYDTQRHGLFTYVFLDALAKSMDPVSGTGKPTARELTNQVSPEVQRLSRRLRQREQTPQVFGSAVDTPLPFIQRP